jgi:alpha-L-fucosidase
MPTISFGGYYYSHAPQEIKDAQGLKAKKSYQTNRNRARLNNLSKKVKEYAKEEIDVEWVKNAGSLEEWFKNVAKEIDKKPYCWNCGEWISPKYYRHASAHIFPKAHFFSVSINPNNYLVLGAGCGCHSEFDSSIEKACKMPVWKIAVERFRLFEPYIKERHKYLELFKSNIK